MRSRVSYVVVGVLICGVLAVGQPTSAHRTGTKSRVTATFTDTEFELPIPPLDDPDTFSGEVFASIPQCEADRKINVYRRLGEGRLDYIVSGKSDANGVWTAEKEDPANGNYFAAVTTKNLGKAGHQHLCLPDRSPTFEVENS